jgi:hypothetical protein
MNEEDFECLHGDFIRYMRTYSDIKKTPIKNKNNKKNIIGWEYTYNYSKGIRWKLVEIRLVNGLTIRGLFVIITPNVLLNKNYITASIECNLKDVEDAYNQEAKRISNILPIFGSCSLNRADYFINIDLQELNIPCTPEQMMILIKRGNIPKHYKERARYDNSNHRMVTDKDSFYLESNSVIINYYWKYAKITENHPLILSKEETKYVIRFEVECKYSKLYSMAKKTINNSIGFQLPEEIPIKEIYEMLISGEKRPSIPILEMLSDETSEEIANSYFYKVIRKGHYFTLEGAKKIVKKHNFRRDKEERIDWVLDLISKERGISKAKEKVSSSDMSDFKQSIRDLDDILVNPVTIPRGWGIKFIPNLLLAYNNMKYANVMTSNEIIIVQHIKSYLNDERIYSDIPC